MLEVDLPIREPGQLDVRGRDRLLSGKVDGRLIVLIRETAIHLKILANALHHLEVDVVEGGSIFDGRAGRGGRNLNKVLRRLLIARAYLNPLVPA